MRPQNQVAVHNCHAAPQTASVTMILTLFSATYLIHCPWSPIRLYLVTENDLYTKIRLAASKHRLPRYLKVLSQEAHRNAPNAPTILSSGIDISTSQLQVYRYMETKGG